MIKDKVGRRRYVLFSVEGEATRTDVIHAINNAYRKKYDDDVPWLTVYEKNYGIVRCMHRRKDDVVDILNSLEANKKFSIRTICTSGTIKKLKEKISNS
jgi:RNase P/RNase MRP subunit POP5